MAWRAALFLFCFWQPLSAWAQSVSDCGAAGDHLKDVKITLSPDPIKRDASWTITVTGTLDETITAGNADVDLTIKALRVINKAVKTTSPFTISPGLVAGPQALAIGPLTLPNIPGSVEASGTIKLTNDKNEPVACVKLDINVPAEAEASQKVDTIAPAVSTEVEGVAMCNQASDHLTKAAFSDSGGVVTLTGTLDELISKMAVNLDLKLKLGWLSHKIDMAIPVSYSPGLVKGDLKVTAGPSTDLKAQAPEIDVTLTGTVKIDDGNAQEITCLNIGASEAIETAELIIT